MKVSVHRFLLVLAALILSLRASSAGFDRKPDLFAGVYVLFERPARVDVLDKIEFLDEGKCLVDQDARTRLPATYHSTPDGHLVIESSETRNPSYTYRVEFHQQSMELSPGEGQLFYLHPPAAPHPTLAEVTGIYVMQTKLGVSVTEITADGHFRARMRMVDDERKAYSEYTMEGTCTYAAGIVTYKVKSASDPEADVYIRDFMEKIDSEGVLWEGDPFVDALSPAKRASTFELPPAPKDYRSE